MEKKLGIIRDLPFLDYRAILDAVSISELSEFARAPVCYKHSYIDGKRRKGSDAQQLGTDCHTYLLEPHEWAKYRRGEKIDKRTTEGKARAAALEKEAAEKGLIYLDPVAYDQIIGAGDSLKSHPFVKEYLPKADPELSIFWTDEETGVYCKARLDAPVAGFGILDVKTTKSAKDFEHSIVSWGYYRQAAYYLDAWNRFHDEKLSDFYFLVVEMEAPHLRRVIQADSSMIEYGRQEYKKLLKRFAECRKTNTWPHLSESVEVASLPAWMTSRMVFEMAK